MDRKWASEQNWPESMRLPEDSTKGVYLLEAYHQLHCLVSSSTHLATSHAHALQRILRKTFWEAVNHEPYTYSPTSHVEHCFDTLRQVKLFVRMKLHGY